MGVEWGEGEGASAKARAQVQMREPVHLPDTAEPPRSLVPSCVLEQVERAQQRLDEREKLCTRYLNKIKMMIKIPQKNSSATYEKISKVIRLSFPVC